MDKSQRKYAMDRVVQIANVKIEAIKAKYTVQAVKLTNSERMDLIASGKVKFVRDSSGYRSSIFDYYDFSKFEKPARINQKAIDTETEIVCKKSREIKDKIMLGDAVEALELLTAFEN